MRLACRLALRLGIDDPELWLESMPARVWAIWKAYFHAEPEQFGFTHADPRESPISIEEQIHNAMSFAGARVPTNETGVVWPPR